MQKYNPPLKLAFIGGSIESAIGYTHFIASQMDNKFKLTAACFSREKSINERTALAWGIPNENLYSNWQELLATQVKNIDALVILTPTPTHCKIILKALDLGYAIISEKALAASFTEGSQILSLVEKKKSFLAVTHNYTGYPMLRELQHMIQANKLGKLTQIRIEMPQESFALFDNQNTLISPKKWRLKDAVIPGISLDLGAHLQHILYFLLQNNPLSLVAHESTFGHFENVVDDVNCMLKYENNIKVQMWYSKAALGHRNGLRIEVFGEKGSALWKQTNPEELIHNTCTGIKQILDRASNVSIANKQKYNRFKVGHPSGFIEAFANVYSDIASELLEYQKGKEPDTEWTYGCKQSLFGLSLFETIKQSSKEERWIKFSKFKYND